MGCGSKRRGHPGDRSPFCAKSLSAIWGPCVHKTVALPGVGTKPELSGVW